MVSEKRRVTVKVSDIFELPLSEEQVYKRLGHAWGLDKNKVEVITYVINNHDRLEQENSDLKHRVKDLSTCVKVSVARNNELKQENSELKGLNAAYRLAYALENLTDEELQIFKVENKETIEKLFKLLSK